MRSTLSSIALMAAGTTMAQSNCELLSIEQIRYAPLDPSAIEVVVANNSPEIFSYPSFVLLDAQGDTLARETVSFFGIGTGAQAHYLVTGPGVALPAVPAEGTLLLEGSFGDTLYCMWDLPAITLCPPEPCVPAQIYLVNTGPLVSFTVNWVLTDPSGLVDLASGSFEMDEVTHTHFDSICLPPGAYTIWLSPFSPINDDFVLGITNSYLFSIGTNVAQQEDPTPLDLTFSWYEACTDHGNAISATEPQAIRWTLLDGALHLTRVDQQALGAVSLYATDGRLLARHSTSAASLVLTVGGVVPGIHLVNVMDLHGHSFTQRFLIP